MTNEEKRLNEIIRREGLSGDIKESIAFFGDKPPLSLVRKAQFAKAAMQLKAKFNVDENYIVRVVDEINTLVMPLKVIQGGKRIYAARDFIGKRFGNFKVVRIVDENIRVNDAIAIFKCQVCGKEKKHTLKYARSHPDKLTCKCGANNRNL